MAAAHVTNAAIRFIELPDHAGFRLAASIQGYHKDHKVQYAIASGPLLAPYANIYTYTMTLFAFDTPLPLAVLVFLTWMNY